MTKLLEFHRAEDALATLTAIRPPGRFGALTLGHETTRIEHFREKPEGDSGWVNGGFFVLEPDVLDYIAGDETVWEREPLERLRQGLPATHRLLAEHSQPARQDGARGAVGERQPAVEDLVAGPACRSCGTRLEHVFADVGSSPLANSFLRAEGAARAPSARPGWTGSSATRPSTSRCARSSATCSSC